MSDSIVQIESEEQLSELIEENGTVLLDFQAEWCGPCKMMEPVIETLAEETEHTIASIDIDEHNALANEYHVQAVPTFILVSDGQIQENLTGVQQEDELRTLLSSY